MRFVAATILLLGLAAGHARIGQPAVDTLNAMEENGLVGAPDFQVEPVVYGDLLFSLSGNFVAGSDNFVLLGEAVGLATGYFEQISGPVAGFLEANLADLVLAGSVVVPVEGSFLLEMDLVQAEDGSISVDWTFGLRELDTSLFQPARHALGADAESARIVIREFADLQCPHCRTFATTVMPLITELLASDPGLRFEFHHLPLVTIHANALPAAEAVECVVAANQAEDFWEYSHAVFERMQAWQQLPDTGPYFVSLAQELGLDTGGVKQCLVDRDHLDHVNGSADHATGALGINGTPSVFVDGFTVTGWNQLASYQELISLIESRNQAP